MTTKAASKVLGTESKSTRRRLTLTDVGQWQGKIFSLFFLFATVQVTIEVFLRYALNSPTTWGLDISIYLCGITYIMGGGYTQAFNEHIRVDVFYSRWSERTRAKVDLLLTDWVFLGVCTVLVWQSGAWAWESIVNGETAGTMWDPPIWPMKSIIVLGALLLLLQACSKIVCDFKVVKGRRRGDS